MHSWNFAQLQRFIEYKAQAKGIKVVYVDARYTSQKCSRCGHTSKKNRRDQARFVCERCGFQLNADLNASRNIVKNYLASLEGKSGPGEASPSRWGAVNRPIVGSVGYAMHG